MRFTNVPLPSPMCKVARSDTTYRRQPRDSYHLLPHCDRCQLINRLPCAHAPLLTRCSWTITFVLFIFTVGFTSIVGSPPKCRSFFPWDSTSLDHSLVSFTTMEALSVDKDPEESEAMVQRGGGGGFSSEFRSNRWRISMARHRRIQ